MLVNKYSKELFLINGIFFLALSGASLSSFFPKNNFAIVYSLLSTLLLIPVIEKWGTYQRYLPEVKMSKLEYSVHFFKFVICNVGYISEIFARS